MKDDARVYWAPGAARLVAWGNLRRRVIRLKYEESKARRNARDAKGRLEATERDLKEGG